MEKQLLERCQELENDAKLLMKERDENNKLKGTKFEQHGLDDNIQIDEKLSGIRKEQGKIKNQITEKRLKDLYNDLQSVSNDFKLPMIKLNKESFIGLEEYSKKAQENLNDLYSTSSVLRERFAKYLEKGYSDNYRHLNIFSTRGDYGYNLCLALKNGKISFELKGYVSTNSNIDYSPDVEEYSFDQIIEQKNIIKLLEEKESSIKFLFRLFVKKENKISFTQS